MSPSLSEVNLQQCAYCHQWFDANLDQGCCHNLYRGSVCGWVNTPENTALLDEMRRDPILQAMNAQADQLLARNAGRNDR